MEVVFIIVAFGSWEIIRYGVNVVIRNFIFRVFNDSFWKFVFGKNLIFKVLVGKKIIKMNF